MHISFSADTLFHLGQLAITNSLLTSLIGTLFIAVLFGLAGRYTALHPKSTFALAVESIFEAILGLIESITHSREKARRFFPLLATFFLFILINNWIGLLPGVGPITVVTDHGAVPLFRGANADLNTTLALAVISVVATHAYAVKQLGLFSHLRKYVSPNPILLFVGILEFISEFAKMVSFSFRLFGNIFAGEVLLVVIGVVAPIIAPLPFFGLELFVGLVQALVFTMLTLVYLEVATSDHGHGEVSAHGREETTVPITVKAT